MSRMDWVPCFRWGIGITLPFASQIDQPLMEPSLAADADVEGRFDETPGRYFVHRIVGVITMNWAATPSGDGQLVRQVIWPGIIDDPTAGGVISTGFIDEPSGVNNRLWFMRHVAHVSTTRFQDLRASEGAEAWGTHVDIKPKQVIDDGQIPILSIFNSEAAANNLVFRTYLRLLLTRLE